MSTSVRSSSSTSDSESEASWSTTPPSGDGPSDDVSGDGPDEAEKKKLKFSKKATTKMLAGICSHCIFSKNFYNMDHDSFHI